MVNHILSTLRAQQPHYGSRLLVCIEVHLEYAEIQVANFAQWYLRAHITPHEGFVKEPLVIIATSYFNCCTEPRVCQPRFCEGHLHLTHIVARLERIVKCFSTHARTKNSYKTGVRPSYVRAYPPTWGCVLTLAGEKHLYTATVRIQSTYTLCSFLPKIITYPVAHVKLLTNF